MAKKILITGKDSYIGTSFERWTLNQPTDFQIDTIDMIDGTWKEKSFSEYDVVFHVAGIAHIKERSDNRLLYYQVNRDLAVQTAQKAKEEGVKHFVFLSTMSVYGIDKGIITKDTPTTPKNAYGESKLEAENIIRLLEDDNFKVAIVRPPMVYGKGCKGNYPRLAQMALKTPIFPRINNKRSMIYIDNLSEFVKLLIKHEDSGLFFPQNAEYVNTSEMVRLIAQLHGKRIRLTRFFNPFLKIFQISMVKKVFGDLVYDMGMSEYKEDYRVCLFEESLMSSEEK